MDKESEFVDYFYQKHQGRIALGVGYNQNMSEIFPFVFENSEGELTGVVALGVLANGKKVVHIYHLGSFVGNIGSGSGILRELCRQADIFDIILTVSAITMSNGREAQMTDKELADWYQCFGFKGAGKLLRKPV